MVVAVIPVGMMQMAVHEVADMVAVGHGFVTAARAMDMALLVAAAIMIWRAAVRVLIGDFDRVLVHMILMRMMQMAVMKIIDMVVVLDCGVAAVRAVLVRVGFVVGKIAAHFSVSLVHSSHACSMALVTRFKT